MPAKAVSLPRVATAVHMAAFEQWVTAKRAVMADGGDRAMRKVVVLVFGLCIVFLAGCKHSAGRCAPGESESTRPGNTQTITLPGGVPMAVHWIPSGTFQMGRHANEQDGYADESPQHAVTLSRGFWMGECEVTQAQWRAVMGTAPWAGQKYVPDHPRHPAVCMSWDDAQSFAAKLSAAAGRKFRLPTEAEWEYACRAGTSTRFYWGDDPAFETINDHAWWRGTALITPDKHARPVGMKRPNAWGLHDMGGNVFEWCQDWHGPYAEGAVTDPTGPETGKRRIDRGGSWMTIGGTCRSARRGYDPPSAALDDLGFRVVMEQAAMASLEAMQAGTPKTTDVFVGGAEGVDTYRIPSLLVAGDGSLLLFCEARKVSIEDASPTDLVLRRSLDGGKTWLPMQVLVRGTGNEALMNPCPVLDRSNHRILLFGVNAHALGENRHKLLLLSSTDHGKTWSAPEEAASRVTGYLDTFVPGAGVGIQMRGGRLIIPGYAGDFDNDTKSGFASRVMYSDDHGGRWTLGDPVPQFSDESEAVELSDGRLMLNVRGDMGTSCRGVAISKDGGRHWAEFRWDRALNECPCQASILRYSACGEPGGPRLLFSNPDNAGETFGLVDRSRMTVRLSYDEGKTWPIKKLIHAGPSSYSLLVRLPDGDIGLVYEGGEKHRREWIRFVRFSLAWLTDGADQS
jgi:sialidase-1